MARNIRDGTWIDGLLLGRLIHYLQQQGDKPSIAVASFA
jgi:hypothetical protein